MQEFVHTIQFFNGEQTTLLNYHESQAKPLESVTETQAVSSESLSYSKDRKRNFEYKDGLVGGELMVPSSEAFEEAKLKLKKLRENEIPAKGCSNSTPLFVSYFFTLLHLFYTSHPNI